MDVVRESGMNQSEFAAKCSVSPGYLTDILKGRTKPSQRVITEICRVNSLNVNWLETGRGEKKVDHGYLGVDILRVEEPKPSYETRAIVDQQALTDLAAFQALKPEHQQAVRVIIHGLKGGKA